MLHVADGCTYDSVQIITKVFVMQNEITGYHGAGSSWFYLPEYTCIAVSGKDTAIFLHAQLTSDITQLKDDTWHWSAFLTAQGRVRSIIAVYRRTEESFFLISPGVENLFLFEQLRSVVIRRKVQLTPIDPQRILGCFCTPHHARQQLTTQNSAGIVLDFGAAHYVRSLCILSEPVSLPMIVTPDAHIWKRIDFVLGLPHLTSSESEKWTTHQLRLDRLKAFSTRKGCYPGQEIVSRLHYLGQSKRQMVLLHAPSGAEMPSDVYSQEHAKLGTVIAIAETVVLAMLPVDVKETRLTLSLGSADITPFISGLAR